MDVNVTLAKIILTNHQKMGLEAPLEIQEAFTALDSIGKGQAQLRVTPDEIGTAVADAILAGHDPATDPNVTRLLTMRLLADHMGNPNEIVNNRFMIAVRTNAANLIDLWRDRFADAASTLVTEAEILGNVNLTTDADAILSRGGDIAEHFVAARDANELCELIRDTLGALGQLAGATINKDRSWNHAAVSVPLPTWEALNLHQRRTAWELVQLGLTLDLATFHTYQERIASHQDTWSERKQEAMDANTGRLRRR